MLTICLAAVTLMGLYMAWTIGANDVANSMGSAVGSKSVSVRNALILAAICEFAGSVLVGSHVTDTVRKGIVSPECMSGTPELLAIGMACALLGAALWLHLATWWGMPVSTTHAIVGAVAGFGVVAAGWGAVKWGAMTEIVASWFISPVAGIILGWIGFKLIVKLILGKERPAAAAIRYWPWIVFVVIMVITVSTLCDKALRDRIPSISSWFTGWTALIVSVSVSGGIALACGIFIQRHLGCYNDLPLDHQLDRVEKVFAPLVVLTGCSVSFAHGANDVANAVGPLAAVFDIMKSGTIHMRAVVPMWILVLGGMGIVLGLATFGARVMATIGGKITQLTPSRAVAANIAAATTVLVCSRMKLPISTTHIMVGAVVGVGLARGLDAVNRNVAKSIFGSWVLSVPAAAVLAVLLFLLCRALHVDAMLRDAMAAAHP